LENPLQDWRRELRSRTEDIGQKPGPGDDSILKFKTSGLFIAQSVKLKHFAVPL
jgi:hypothetical protein